MIGKFGSDQQQLADLGGGVISEDGATLLSGESTGEASLLAGPALLREQQTLVANGDFAIPPADAEATITADNALPYWSFTDVNSAGAITCAIVADAAAGSGKVLRWSVAANTTTTKSAVLSRFIPIAASRDQAYSYMPELALGAATSTTLRSVVLTMQFYEQDQTTTTGTALSETRNFSLLTGTVASLFPSTNQVRFNAPSDAAFLKISIEVNTTGTFASVATIDMYEVRTNVGQPILQVAERASPASYGPGAIWMQSGVLQFSRNTPTAYSGSQQDLAILTNGTVVVSTNLTVNANSLFNGNATVGGTLIGAGVTTDLKHGITLQRTTNLTVNTSVDASATAITWSSAVKNTSLYAYWSTGSTIAIPLTGWYSITCHLISGTGLGTGFAFRLYALVNGTVIAESETQAGANTTSDTFSISTIAYLTAADSLVFRASASAASKTIGGSRRSACSVVYLGNTSA